MALTDEYLFRLAFGIFWILSTGMRVCYQARAQGAQKSFSRNERQAKLGFRVLAIVYLLLPIYCLTTWFDFAHLDLAEWLRWSLGVLFSAAYLFLFGWTHLTLGKHWSGLLEIHDNHQLVTSGPYRRIRHPMYTAFMISVLGFFFLSANWLISALYLLAVVSMIFPRIVPEEQMMTEHFGESYKQYKRQTGRLLPRLRTPPTT